MRWLLVCVLAAGCGRIGFGAAAEQLGDAQAGGAGDATVDASVPCGSNADCGPCQRCGSDLTCAAEPIVTMALGHRSTCFIGSGGSRWCAGENVGLGSDQPQPLFPTRIEGEDGWTALAVGFGDSVGLRNGALWGWGGSDAASQISSNGYTEISDQLNVDCELDASGAATCASAGTWSYVSAGQSAFCGIQPDDSLWCWGSDQSNDLGQGVVTDPYTLANPTRVGSDMDWLTVEIGNDVACALKTDHTLWCWGEPADTGTNYVDTMGVPTQISSDTDWTSLQLKWDHACAGKTGGVFYCWGDDEYGLDVIPGTTYVGMPTLMPGTYDQLLLGGHHYCDENGGVWSCWGWNGYGQLGVGDLVTRNAPGGPALCTTGS